MNIVLLTTASSGDVNTIGTICVSRLETIHYVRGSKRSVLVLTSMPPSLIHSGVVGEGLRNTHREMLRVSAVSVKKVKETDPGRFGLSTKGGMPSRIKY